MPRRLPANVAARRGTDRRTPRVKAGVGAAPPSSSAPKPPRNVRGVERRIWVELAEQAERQGTYNAATLTAFRMLVKCVTALELVDPAKTRPTAYAQLQRAASGWLAKFGLTPADQAAAAPNGQAPDRFGTGAGAAAAVDPVERFLFGGAPKLEVVRGGRRG